MVFNEKCGSEYHPCGGKNYTLSSISVKDVESTKFITLGLIMKKIQIID